MAKSPVTASPIDILEPGRMAGKSIGELTLSRIVKTYESVRANDDISLAVRGGEFVSLLGPSGSGKTTTLNVVAGFVEPDSGSVVINGRDVTVWPPYRRNLGMVFQNYALFPHMTAAENVGFPLSVRRVPSDQRRRLVEAAIQMVGLHGKAGRYPRQLSGGEQQRVAFARAISFQPSLLLLDEPLGALDRNLRDAMQLEIKRISRELRVTVLYVTHDQEEALSLSDRIAVYRQGRIEQIGTGEDLYERPASRFVAGFVGESTILPGIAQVSPDGPSVMSSEYELPISPRRKVLVGFRSGDRVAVVIRPERLHLEPRSSSSQTRETARVNGILVSSAFLGSSWRYVVDVAGGQQALIREPSGSRNTRRFQPGDEVTMSWHIDDAVAVRDV